MSRHAVIVLMVGLLGVAMLPSAAGASEKMMSPDQKKKMAACERQAERQHIKMSDRAKFLMTCMTARK
jgi:hypothetical protein